MPPLQQIRTALQYQTYKQQFVGQLSKTDKHFLSFYYGRLYHKIFCDTILS